jgi:hypothetical protein
VGDILFKDASITHRAHYLAFLKASVLPADMPPIDIKVKHKDPLGNKIMLLTVRCGKSVATKVTEYLTQTLNGQGERNEVFISKLGLGAVKMNRSDLARIYQHHHNYLKDIHHLPFTLTRNIDSTRIEYNDDGQTTERSPRNWATTLEHEGKNLSVDIENGTKDGATTLIVPHENLILVQTLMRQYLQRQNPALVNAEKFYDNLDIDPSIPVTIFTINVTSLLNRELKPPRQATAVPKSDSTAASSLHSAPSKDSNAWSVPLFPKPKVTHQISKSVGGKSTTTKLQNLAKKDAALLGRIALLEEQLQVITNNTLDTKSVTSDTSTNGTRTTTNEQQSKISAITGSGKSNNSQMTIESAHQRLETIESKMDSIQTMLMTLMENYKPAKSTSDHDESMSDDDSDKLQCTQKLSYDTPKRTPTTKNKRHKPTDTPDSSLQYNETMDLSGDSKC